MTLTFRAKTHEGWTVDSPLKPFWFPGGEAHLKGTDEQIGAFKYQIADLRGADPRDLMMLQMWADACYQRDDEKMVLLVPYLPGARADRGNPFGAQVYANLINGLFVHQTIALDPHSPVMPSLISSSESIPPDDGLTVYPFEHIIRREIQDSTSDSRAMQYVGVIAPDKGAVVRATRAARVMGVPVYKAEKTRDFETGRLTGFHIDDLVPAEGRLLIVDDICDGGGTFNGLADAIDVGADRLDLWVTHGIFSKGFDDLARRFGMIHTTDSWFGDTRSGPIQGALANGILKIHPVLPYLTEAISL